MNVPPLRVSAIRLDLLSALLFLLNPALSAQNQEPVVAPTVAPFKVSIPVQETTSLADGRAMLHRQDIKGAIAAFTAITEAQPDNGRAWFFLAFSVHIHGKDWPRTIELHKKASSYPDEKLLSLYNLACAYSRSGDQRKALESLSTAFNAGYDRIVKVNTDPDLIELRKTAAFRAYWATTGRHEQAKALETPTELRICWEERQLDFILGDWNVYVDSRLSRISSIDFVLGGQSLRETGTNFESTFTWIAEEKLWRQSWISHNSHHDLLEGKFAEGALVLEQDRLPDYPEQVGRLTIRTVNENKFFMAWEHSTSEGQWSPPSLQEYRRRAPMLTFPEQTLSSMASEAPTQTAQYEFKLGRWDVTCRSKSPHGGFKKGTGTSTCYFAEDGLTILDDLVVTFNDQRSFEGQTIRRFDAKKGHWVCSWNPKEGRANNFIATYDPASGRMIETSSGTDYRGEYEGKMQFYEVSEGAYHGRSDRNYRGPDCQIGQWEYVATRMPQ
jgi:tetratricopeptide (TPR) repeat protein